MKNDFVIRKPFEASVPCNLACPEETRTKQSFRDECDVNQILAKWQRTGLIDHVASSSPQYGDFSEVVDYQSAVNTVLQADASFMALPSSIRARFDNDPGLFLDFVHNPANAQELVSLGLANAVQDVVSSVNTTITSSTTKAEAKADV